MPFARAIAAVIPLVPKNAPMTQTTKRSRVVTLRVRIVRVWSERLLEVTKRRAPGIRTEMDRAAQYESLEDGIVGCGVW